MHTTQMAKSGAAAYAILPLPGARHLVQHSEGSYRLIPQHLHSPLTYSWAEIRRGSQKNSVALDKLTQYVQSSQVKNLILRYGLVPNTD